jgi:hypothetical protein
MATTPQQGFIRSRLNTVALPIDTAVASGAINAGDMVYYVGGAGGIGCASLTTPGSSNANAAYFVGVAQGQYPIPVASGITETGSAGNFPTVTTAPTILVMVEGDFQFKTTASDSLTTFTEVYVGADGQTVQVASSGDSIGTVSPDQIRVSGTIGGTVTGAAGVNVVVHIKPNLS